MAMKLAEEAVVGGAIEVAASFQQAAHTSCLKASSAFPLFVLSMSRFRSLVILHRLVDEGFFCRVSRTHKHFSSVIGGSRDLLAELRA